MGSLTTLLDNEMVFQATDKDGISIIKSMMFFKSVVRNYSLTKIPSFYLIVILWNEESQTQLSAISNELSVSFS